MKSLFFSYLFKVQITFVLSHAYNLLYNVSSDIGSVISIMIGDELPTRECIAVSDQLRLYAETLPSPN